MNASDLTFGVELEVTMPTRTQLEVGAYHRGLQVEGLPAGWNAQRDCSIQTTSGRYGVEIVSPVLRGADGIRQVLAVVEWLVSKGARVNASTGCHVHVGFDREDAAALKRLVHLVAGFEKAIFASTGTKSRENGRFCGSIRETHRGLSFSAPVNAMGDAVQNRYHVLNLSNLAFGNKPTVEFRAFAGTLNACKIIGHIFMCLGLVERALKAKTSTTWDAKTPVESSPIHRSGEGQTALTRLYYQLGWTKGRAKEVYGTIEVEGAPELKSIKRKLMEMAGKYDSGAELVAE